MQSLSRQLRRGNAVIAVDGITKQSRPVVKRGTPYISWRHALRTRDEETERMYIAGVVRTVKSNKVVKHPHKSC